MQSTPQIADLVAAGKVKLEVALSLPLEDAAKAHDQVGWATPSTRPQLLHGVAGLAVPLRGFGA
jgi:hypothetical protein